MKRRSDPLPPIVEAEEVKALAILVNPPMSLQTLANVAKRRSAKLPASG
jgi:hypothetical protein